MIRGLGVVVLVAGLAAAALGCEGETVAADEAEASSSSGEGAHAPRGDAASSGSGSGSGEGGAGGSDSGVGGAGGGFDCADAPLVTWATFGDAFATRHCTGCHASTTIDRHGAPEGVDFDDKDTFLAYGLLILELVDRDAEDPIPEGDTPMPPGGGVDADERTLLRTWLTCNVELDRAAE